AAAAEEVRPRLRRPVVGPHLEAGGDGLVHHRHPGRQRREQRVDRSGGGDRRLVVEVAGLLVGLLLELLACGLRLGERSLGTVAVGALAYERQEGLEARPRMTYQPEPGGKAAPDLGRVR